MASMAHHMVVATVETADGSTRFGRGAVFAHYSTLDRIGIRSVRRELAARYPGARISVEIDASVGQFAATIRMAE